MTGSEKGEVARGRHELKAWAANRGCEIGWGPVAVLDEVRAEIERRREAGELDEEFDRERLSWFRYPEGIPITDAKSVIVVAVPRPAHTIRFTLNDGGFSAVIPPTYVHYSQTREAVRRDLDADIFRGRHQLHVLVAPLKAVAARLGIVVYGRNNITYAPRFGSYFQLVGLITDAELVSTGEWCPEAPRALSACGACNACMRACPTGAIGEDRFLLHAERCLTLFTEASGPWPTDLSPNAHHCLVGCMRCQEVCPENAGRFRLESTGTAFTAAETESILADDISSPSGGGQRAFNKLTNLGLDDFGAMLGRNLRALIGRRVQSGGMGGTEDLPKGSIGRPGLWTAEDHRLESKP